jgi:hypothetical protein
MLYAAGQPVKRNMMDHEIIDTAYHEIGHFLLLYLFKSDFEINSISLNNNDTKSDINNPLGLLDFKVINHPSSDINQLREKIAISALGGICCQNIHGTLNYTDNRYDEIFFYFRNPKRMNKEGCSKDLLNVKLSYSINKFEKRIGFLDYFRTYVWFIFSFMIKDCVWDFTKKFASELLSKDNFAMDKIEINKLVSCSEFEIYLNKDRETIIKEDVPFL